MQHKYKRGSEWIKCDLHLPTPETIKNDGFKSSNDVWSDFKWGMLNWELSALRCLLGEDWDNLDK